SASSAKISEFGIASLLVTLRQNEPITGHRSAQCPAILTALSRSDRFVLLVLGIRTEHKLADAVLRRDIGDGPQQREAGALTVDGILARRERDAAAGATTSPDAEADQLQAVELAADEMQLGFGEFVGRVAFLVRLDSYADFHNLTS